jgi:DNA-binding NarL/FixJ family response regulator
MKNLKEDFSKFPIQVILAEEQVLFRNALSDLLLKDTQIQVVAEIENGEDLVNAVFIHKPDILVANLNMLVKTGIQALHEISILVCTVKIIIISESDDEYNIVSALEAGALGYVVKKADCEEFINAIKYVYSGKPYYCSTTMLRMSGIIAKSSFDPYTQTVVQIFSQVEKKIIMLICHDLSSSEIGIQLFMGKKNIDLHRIRILKKMKVKTSAGVAIYALKHKLVSLDDIKL